MQLNEVLKAQGWRDLDGAPADQDIELLIEKNGGGYRTETGRVDEVEGGFYAYSELWPVPIDPVAWRPVCQHETGLHLAGSILALGLILAMIYFLNH